MNLNIPIKVWSHRRKIFELKKIWIRFFDIVIGILTVLFIVIVGDVIVFGRGSLVIEFLMANLFKK
jgi:hypothetical protein